MSKLYLASLLFVFTTFAAAAESPWVVMTKADLQAIHDTLLADHPGPVDPQNPGFRRWLEDGLKEAKLRAAQARSLGDYRRAALFYTNGFRDDHISLSFDVRYAQLAWPGFVVVATSAEFAEVVSAETDAGVKVGARLLSCDGRSLDDLMSERVDPFRWNRDLPHERYIWINDLFSYGTVFSFTPRGDDETFPHLQSCLFSTGNVVLKWRMDADQTSEKIFAAQIIRARQPLLQHFGQFWMISLPTFNYFSEKKVAEIRHLLADISEHADEIRKSTIVFDVRGNGGGDSDWGDRVVEAVWGKDWLDHVADRGGTIVDWRATADNVATMDRYLAMFHRNGQGEQLRELQSVRDAVSRALKERKPYAHIVDAQRPHSTMPPTNPVIGRVYFLTDRFCGSACLDFADRMLALPNVIQIGLPTYADSVYIDASFRSLPSGLGELEYGMKVYRDRVRKNNEWYEPKIRWPGGPMTDEAVIAWIKTLH